MSTQAGSSTSGATASYPTASYPTPAPLSSSPKSSPEKKVTGPQTSPHPPVLPSLPIIPKKRAPRPRQRKTPPALAPVAPLPQPQRRPQIYPDDSDEEYPAPPYSPITPPPATTPPPISSNSKTGASTLPAFVPTMAPKTVTHIPPPVIPPNFASMGGRAPLTHVAHPETVAAAAPPPLQPIDFNENTDVLALQATIGILLRQRQQAEADIRQLSKARQAAMERPLDFYNDLMGGSVTQGTAKTQDDNSDDDEMEVKTEEDGVMKMEAFEPSAMEVNTSKKKEKKDIKGKGKAKATPSPSTNTAGPSSSSTAPAPWLNLPKQQDIVRMPAINWAQYAVEGEAFDRLHNVQRTHPTRGTPAVIAPNGTYSFTGAANPDDGKKKDGISAPFNPLLDQVAPNKKPAKGGAAGGPRKGDA